MKKILLVATEYAPGMIPFAASIIKLLKDKEGENILKVYCITVNGLKLNYYKELAGVSNVVYIDYPQNKVIKLIYKFYPFAIIRTIENLVRTKKIDIIHFLTGDFSIFPYIFFSKQKDKIYYTVHDLHPHESEMSFWGRILHRYVLWAQKKNRRLSKHLTTSSYQQFLELKQSYSNKDVTFMHFPSLVTDIIVIGNKIVPETRGLENYILFFGTVDYYKGIDLLINAYEKSIIANKYKLVIAGKGKLAFNNSNIIRINRFIEDEEIKDLFEKARVVVYPYRSATMSGVLSLAFYFQKDVLASEIPFFKEYENSSIHYFHVGDSEDLRLQLENILLSKRNMLKQSVYKNFYSSTLLFDDLKKIYKI